MVYYLAPNFWKNRILLLGSLAFYFVGTYQNPEHLILLIFSIFTDFGIGLQIEKSQKHKKAYLLLGVSLHLISLITFKYLGFILGEIVPNAETFDFLADIVLPIGISFYTFQGISYLADVYRNRIKAEKSLLRYAVYISMFEQLIAGPIVTYGQVQDQLQTRKPKPHGMGTFVVGLGLKVLLANPIWKLWSQTCAIGFESVSTPLAWMAAFAYTFHIYFDFFGYSLMAIGLGKMLGFDLPKNFDYPYLSRTMTEFWRRWHMTLGSWFKEYVYIPMGGNRNGTVKTIRNLLIVWVLTGIWHGAGYNFWLWGVTLALLIILEKYVYGKFLEKNAFLSHLYMLIVIPLSWMVFAIDDMKQLGIFFTRLFPFWGEGPWSVFRYDYVKYFKMYWPFLLAGIFFSTKIPFQWMKKIENKVVLILFLGVIFIACVFCMYKGLNDPFLYFRF